MKKIEYIHQNPESKDYERATLAIELPNKQKLLNIFSNSNEITLNIGASFVHPKDRYVKSIGREQSNKTIGNTICTIAAIKFQPADRWVFHFTCIVPNTRPYAPPYTSVEFALSVVKDSDRVRLEYGIVK